MSRVSASFGLFALFALQSSVTASPEGVTVPAAINIAGTVNEDRINVRRGPGNEYDRFHLLDRGSPLTATAVKGEWVQIRLSNGQLGWINGRYVVYSTPLPASITAGTAAARTTEAPKPAENPRPAETPKPTPAPEQKSGASAAAQGAPTSGLLVRLPAGAPASGPASGVGTPGAASAAASKKTEPATETKHDAGPAAKETVRPDPRPIGAALAAATKSDVLSQTQSSPATAVGDGWKMILYLVPVLAVVLLAVRFLKAVQQRGGDITTLRGSLLGGLNLANAKKNGGSSIKVLETVPMGTAALHLVEVRGRTLLLGAAGGSLNLLTELKAAGRTQNDDFEALLRRAGAPEEAYKPAGITVGDLEDELRETKEAIIRAARQSRLASSSARNGETRRG